MKKTKADAIAEKIEAGAKYVEERTTMVTDSGSSVRMRSVTKRFLDLPDGTKEQIDGRISDALRRRGINPIIKSDGVIDAFVEAIKNNDSDAAEKALARGILKPR